MATFTLDEPIVCSSSDNFECSVVVNISNSHPHLVAVEPCFVRWERTEWHQQRQVRITAVQNYRSVPSEQHQIHLNAQVLSLAAYYDNFDVQDFFIETRNRRTAQCRSTGDPHYSTFDGRYWHYYRASTVTLYRAPNRDFAVQTRTTGYPGRNCAIAGREDRDRVIIDNCGGRLRVLTDFHSSNPEVHPRVQVSGRTYTVYFYSGAWVRAQVNRWGMNVYTASVDATPSNAPAAHKYSCGLCGNFNGNRADDVPGYRVTSYNALWPCMKVPSVATRPSDNAIITFGNIWTWVYNEADFTNLTSIVPLPQVDCPYEFQRIVRPIINTDDVEDITEVLRQRADDANGGDFGFTFGNDNGTAVVNPGFSLDLAARACQRNIDQSVTVQRCAQLYASFNLSLTNYTEDCAEDYAHAGGPTAVGLDFLAAALRALEAECLALAVQNNDTSLVALQQVLCDNACSQQGSCGVGSRCTCNTGFGGSDCSVNLNAAPTIALVSDVVYDSAGLQRNHTPTEVLITGTNFLSSPNLTCRFNTTRTRATYIGVTQVLCQVPVFIHRGILPLIVPLQVSNDGVLWSNATAARFTYYDSTCVACNASGTCGPNPSTCIIEGQCYLPHVARPATSSSLSNPCQICLPSASNTDWTFDYSPQSCHPVFSLPIYAEEIVGAATGATEILRVNGSANSLVTSDPHYRVNYTYSSNVNDPRITQWFDVHPTTGAVTLRQTVNMSDPVFMNMQHAATNPQNFNGFFRVIAMDQQGYTTVTDVTIDLLPLTVHGAIFPPLGFAGVIPENATRGDPVMNHSNTSQPLILAPDPSSNATVTLWEWFLQPTGGIGALQINSTTGAVTVLNGALLDHETLPHLNFRVRATVSLQYVTPLFVEVTDVPEPPIAVVTSPTELLIREGNRSSDFVANLSTADGDATTTNDGGPFTYVLVNAVDVFEIRERESGNSSTSFLAVRASLELDFETGPQSYSVTVQTTDPAMLSVNTTFIVHVVDVNEGPTAITVLALPSASRPAGVNVTQSGAGANCVIVAPEDLAVGTLVAELVAADPDANGTRPQCFVTDSLGKFHEDSQRQFMEVEGTLDFETNASFTVAITCADAEDFSLETSIFCNVTVTDAAEPPQLRAYDYVGGAINETEVRLNDRVVGIITAIDPDDDSGNSTITFTAPSGFTTSNRSCTILLSGAVECTVQLVLLSNTTLSFANSTQGVINVHMNVSQGGLSNIINVNVTVSDQPELPTGMSLILQNPTVVERPVFGTVVGRIALDDPDTTPQNFSVTLSNNPNGAYSLETITGDPSSRLLKVANSDAFDFVEALPVRRGRRQANNEVPFTITVCEPAHPHIGCVSFSASVNVSDRALQPSTNATAISSRFGDPGVQFTLLFQDIPELEAHLRWTLESTSLSAAMGNVSLSPAGVLTVSSSRGLCSDGGVTSFLVFAHYDFSSFGSPLPNGYGATRMQAELTIMLDPPTPSFVNVPAAGFQATVKPFRASSLVAETTVSVSVGAPPCNVQVGYVLSVIMSPTAVAANATLTGAELVRVGSEGRFIRPASLTELLVNLASGVWLRRDVFTANEAPVATGVNAPFAFASANLANTGSATLVRVSYLPSASPALPVTDTSLVLLAEIPTSRRVVTAPITVQYLDPCGVDAAGNQVEPSTCSLDEVCVSLFQNGVWDFTCSGILINPLPTDRTSDSVAGQTSDSDNLGLWIGIALAVIVIVLIAAFLYLRRQKNAHETWESHLKRQAPQIVNPTYEAAGAYTETPPSVAAAFKSGEACAMYDWYKPTMSRRDCVEYLMTQGEGSFVVRDSDSNPGWHMLGVKSKNLVIHDKIRLTESGEYELLPSVGQAADVKQPTFTTLPELVEHYLLNGEEVGLGYSLVDSNPIYDNHHLVQERTGVAVEAKYDEAAALPEKRHYDQPPDTIGAYAAATGDGVSNPMYGRDPMEPPRDRDGYLDVGDTAAPYESI